MVIKIEDIPTELKVYMLSFADEKSRLNYALTSKENQNLLSNKLEWPNSSLPGSLFVSKVLGISAEEGVKNGCMSGNIEMIKHYIGDLDRRESMRIISTVLMDCELTDRIFSIVGRFFTETYGKYINRDVILEASCKYDNPDEVAFYMKFAGRADSKDWCIYSDFWNTAVQRGNFRVLNYLRTKGLSRKEILKSNSILHAIVKNNIPSIAYLVREYGITPGDVQKSLINSYERDLVNEKTLAYLNHGGVNFGEVEYEYVE